MFVLNFPSVAAFDFDSYPNSNCINASYLLTTLLCWVSIPLFLPAHYATAFVAESCQQLLCVCRVHCEVTRHTRKTRLNISSMREGWMPLISQLSLKMLRKIRVKRKLQHALLCGDSFITKMFR